MRRKFSYFFFGCWKIRTIFLLIFLYFLQNLNKNKQNIYNIEIVVTEAHDRIVNVFKNLNLNIELY